MPMKDRLVLGWREWASLPDLGIPALKVKVDTGAKTSTLHAFDVEPEESEGRLWVHFGVHPMRKRRDLVIRCRSQVVDQRNVSDSGGHRQMRFVIESLIKIGEQAWPIELTLTNRDTMLFPMLLGRSAMNERLLVDPDGSYTQGRGLGRVYKSWPDERREGGR
jgi:hypothetical protein